MKKMSKLDKAQKLVDRLVELDADEGLQLRALSILNRIKLPMSDVLSKMPGSSVSEKCRMLGISRQTYYAWLRGASRPNTKLSKKLSEWTSHNWEDIQGGRLSPPRSTPSLAAPSSI